MDLHSLPSPFDPIHHGGRRLDLINVQTDVQQVSSDLTNKEPIPVPVSVPVPTAAALWPSNSGTVDGSSTKPSSVPASPHAVKRLASLSCAGMENGMGMGIGMDPISTQDYKSNSQSPSGNSRFLDGTANGSMDGAASKIVNRPHQSHSWAGLVPGALPIQQLSANTGAGGTPSSRTHSYASIPHLPAASDTALGLGLGSSTGKPSVTTLASASGSLFSAAAPASGSASGSLPSVEEVARSVIQQLVLGSPRSHSLGGFLGLVSQSQGSVQPSQPSTTAAAPTTTMPATVSTAPAGIQSDGLTPNSSVSNYASYTQANSGPALAQFDIAPPVPLVSAPDGNFFPAASELSRSAVPSTSGSVVVDAANPSVPIAAVERRAEQILDQHLLSSQKVAAYRHSADPNLTTDSIGAQSTLHFLSRLFGLHGQVAIVTGAARGIGLALARGLAMAGARVCMADMNFDQVSRESSALNDELKQADATFPLCVDVTKRESIVNLFTTTVEHYGMISICVNNAGLAISGEDPKRNYSESFSEEDFDLTINLNLKAVFFCCQFAARWMIANSVQGSIINIASMSAKVVNWPQRQSVYNASKAAVVQLTKCLAVEWCSYGIRVNSISPGYIDTPLNRQISIAHLRHEWTKKTPQHRLGDPRDLVAAVIYLSSNRASAFTTGENIVIDGGYTLW